LILEEKITPTPIEEWMKYQGRFRHLVVEAREEEPMAEIQKQSDAVWDRYRKEYL
jgi:pyruvate/2-oxoacid:ferredoxin oxidoreductase beta subunit